MTERRWRAFHEQASCGHVSKESLRCSSWTETAHDRAMAAEMGVCGGCWMCGWGIGELRIFSLFFLRVIVSDLDASRWQPQPQSDKGDCPFAIGPSRPGPLNYAHG
jgi:hypothetical protein